MSSEYRRRLAELHRRSEAGGALIVRGHFFCLEVRKQVGRALPRQRQVAVDPAQAFVSH